MGAGGLLNINVQHSMSEETKDGSLNRSCLLLMYIYAQML